LVLRWFETRGNAAVARFSELAETLDGAEISFETLFVFVVHDEKVRRAGVFGPEDEADARALFDELMPAPQPEVGN
jgi:hypothetical protein